MEVLAAQRALTIKDDELKIVLGRLEAREKELQRLKVEMVEDANDLRKLYALPQERIGEKVFLAWLLRSFNLRQLNFH